MAAQAPFTFDRAPVTFGAYFDEQLRNWEALFPAEQSYFQRLHELTEKAPATFFGPLREIEERMGVTTKNWPRGRFTLEQVDFLNRHPLYSEWRRVVAGLFEVIDRELDQQAAAKGQTRVIVVISPGELPVGPDRLWKRIEGRGKRIPIEPFEAAAWASRLAPEVEKARGRYTAWSIEAPPEARPADSGGVRLNYEQLITYRKRLMSEVKNISQDPSVRGPRQLGERLRNLQIRANESSFAEDRAVAEFVRATLLNGNGTLLVNNTFVEWAGVQAVRRARPHFLSCVFGIRNKVKPFSSLLIYEDQELTSPIPTQADMLGSYVDLEIFYLYLWQEVQKYVEYRNNTAGLFVAEGMDEMMVIAPPDFTLPDGRANVSQLERAIKDWMRL